MKDAGFLSCSQYDRNDPTLRHPPECNWFDSPGKPSADGSSDPALGEAPSQTGAVLPALGLGAVLLAGMALRARRRGGSRA